LWIWNAAFSIGMRTSRHWANEPLSIHLLYGRLAWDQNNDCSVLYTGSSNVLIINMMYLHCNSEWFMGIHHLLEAYLVFMGINYICLKPSAIYNSCTECVIVGMEGHRVTGLTLQGSVSWQNQSHIHWCRGVHRNCIAFTDLYRSSTTREHIILSLVDLKVKYQKSKKIHFWNVIYLFITFTCK